MFLYRYIYIYIFVVVACSWQLHKAQSSPYQGRTKKRRASPTERAEQKGGLFQWNLEGDWSNPLPVTFQTHQSAATLAGVEPNCVQIQSGVKKSLLCFFFFFTPSSSERTADAAASRPTSVSAAISYKLLLLLLLLGFLKGPLAASFFLSHK